MLQVLQKSIDYIQYLLQQRRRQEDERNALRKDVVALRIMQANYEQIVKAQHSVPGHNEQRLTDQDKFQVVSRTYIEQLDRIFETGLYILRCAVKHKDLQMIGAHVLKRLES